MDSVVQQLVKEQAAAKVNSDAWKAEAARKNAELVQMLNPEAYVKAAGKNETGGSTTVTEHGAKFTMEMEKKVKWDSKKLQAIAAKLPWAQVEAVFKISFEVTEAVYKSLVTNANAGLFPKETLALIDDARTVEISEAKIKSAEIVTT